MDTITEEGKQKLIVERDQLMARREGVIERLKSAKELGDLRENSEYIEAREDQSAIDVRVQEIESILRNATVSEGPKDTSVIEVGNTVDLDRGGKPVTFTIVGSVETDPSAGEISNESPIGSALVGASVGDEIHVELPSGTAKFIVKKIS